MKLGMANGKRFRAGGTGTQAPDGSWSGTIEILKIKLFETQSFR